jgi:peptide/nickel transport system substrate-binding protein
MNTPDARCRENYYERKNGMKNWFIFSLLIVVAGMLLLVGCSPSDSTTTAAATTAVKTTTPAATTASQTPIKTTNAPTTTVAASDIIKGGVLRRIVASSPTNLGYPPGGSTDVTTLERLCISDVKAEMQPNLAESWDINVANKTFTWHVRKGVKFTDGTVFDAKALKWNFEKYTAGGRMYYGEVIKSYDIVDDYTLRMNLTSINNQMLFNWGMIAMMSPTAFEKNGEEWCRLNPVSTASFTLSEYKRDSVMKMVKNPNYWMQGLPYLDRLEMLVIPDNMVASAMMQTGDADIWYTTAQFAVELDKKGFKITWETGGVLDTIAFDSKKADSVFANKLVREAVEYAIDRPALANKIGYGVYEPATQMERKGLAGYNEGFDPRPYNPAKARELLKQAGYPNGFKTTLMTNAARTDTATAVKAYLAAVGIDVTVDIADQSRYIATAYRNGWKGMALVGMGVGPNGASIINHFGASPFTFRSGVEYKSPEYLAKCETMVSVYTDAEFKAAAKAVIKQASDDAMTAPLFFSNSAIVYPSYVHSTFGSTSSTDYNPRYDWMGKR